VDSFDAIYVRVSTSDQTLASQLPDLEQWASTRQGEVQWFSDHFTGMAKSRPGWDALWSEVQRGRVRVLCVWRLDRLGRRAGQLVQLGEDLDAWKITFVSLKEGIDRGTSAGRMLFNVLSSVAFYEWEVRGERQRAGIAAAKAKGRKWGGSKSGRVLKLTQPVRKTVLEMHENGHPVSLISRATRICRKSVYLILNGG
jgi:DNA invertase Pin-like site-specific DNA recombinase